MSVYFGALTKTFGASRIASSAYQKWPTRNLSIHMKEFII